MCVDRCTSHVIFTMHIARLIMCILTAWLKTSHSMCLCARISFHLHAIHDVCLSVRWLFLVCLFVFVFLLFLSVGLPLLFLILPVLGPALHLQCRQRRGLKPLHSRRMRSIAPWRYTILSLKGWSVRHCLSSRAPSAAPASSPLWKSSPSAPSSTRVGLA